MDSQLIILIFNAIMSVLTALGVVHVATKTPTDKS